MTNVNFNDLFDLREDTKILNRLPAPIAIKCKQIIDDVNATKAQRDWARKGYENPDSIKRLIIWPMLIANMDKTKTQIVDEATDAQIQANVNAAIDALIADLSDPS